MCVSVSRRYAQCFTLTGSDHTRRLLASFSQSASGTLYTDTFCFLGALDMLHHGKQCY